MSNIHLQDYQTIMNIVHLEGRIDELKHLSNQLKYQSEIGKYILRIGELEAEIRRITQQRTPKELFDYYINNGKYC